MLCAHCAGGLLEMMAPCSTNLFVYKKLRFCWIKLKNMLKYYLCGIKCYAKKKEGKDGIIN
ncbi:MAG: hypothetical protein A2460_00975 [Omnitrophica WOR_2 bacterium RIFOXYC2_FULL_43_9]|nr:MAG: hypothetical protein A2460_00975 [Omnitrophica WOR_2 bacterium RIFOXYC2_FULL_43_9]